MAKLTTIFLFIISTLIAFGQSIDKPFSKNKMKIDLEVFKEIRQKANSGLYKYRTKDQIDSMYIWAEKEIDISNTYLDFYNIICKLTDFEGSCHNNTSFSKKHLNSFQEEVSGYFPYPLIWVNGKWRINFDNGEIPLGSEMVEINNIPIENVMLNLYKYYTTDGKNITGKRIGLRRHFSKYYRWHYGPIETFRVVFKSPDSKLEESKNVTSVSYKKYYRNIQFRHSKPYDYKYYSNLKPNQKYKYEQIDSSIGVFTIYDLGIGGNKDSEEHKIYLTFLDSIFITIKDNNLQNLIVDIRQCSGGTDPNDVVTYSFLTSRTFQESKQVWSSFQKLPLVKYYNSPFPRFIRPFGVGKYNKQFKRRFPIEKDGKYFIDKDENEMKVRKPNKNNFEGHIYLLISPAVASAGSLFAAMVAGNENAIALGEETMGGYYGHNGHVPLGYVLPKSKIVIDFFMENIEQDVPIKSNQLYDRGIIPDIEISQTLEDFLNNEDTQLKFTLNLIKNK